MATSVRLDPLAHEALQALKERLESEEGRDASDRQIVSALVYGATPAQTAGMLIAFTRAAKRPRSAGEARESR
jgi:hypothetical protein